MSTLYSCAVNGIVYQTETENWRQNMLATEQGEQIRTDAYRYEHVLDPHGR